MPIQAGVSSAPFRARFDRPLFIVSAPRSGSTLLFDTLAKSPDLVTIGGESHRLIEGIGDLSMPARSWTSNRLVADDATADVAERLAQAFYASLRDREGHPADGTVRMLEKTPKNALRVPFFDAAWPDAHFVFLYRDVRQTMASMMEAWRSGYFRTYPRLPNWTGLPWSMLLIPGWEGLIGKPLAEIVAHQWATTVEVLVNDLEGLPSQRVRGLDYDEFIAAPTAVIDALTASLDLSWDRVLEGGLPLSKTTVSRPDAEKWRRFEAEIEAVMPIVAEAEARAKTFLRRLSA